MLQGAILTLSRNKYLWIFLTAATSILALTINYGYKILNSYYKTDFGNGIIIYADDYVKTGRWIFDCNYSRLISRTPLSAPALEKENHDRYTIGEMHSLKKSDREQAKIVIGEIMKAEGWHKELRYIYSGLDTDSRVNVNVFNILSNHNGRPWVLEVRDWIGSKSLPNIEITAEPYTPETYMSHAKALQAAAKSCPKPQ